MAQDPVPVTLLSGFLGAGKTTLMNHLLASEHGEKIAVVVNEFGDVNIDGSLIVGTSEDMIELQNGCICCTIRGDMRDTVLDLLERRERKFWRRIRFDRIVIEASGMASPGPVVQTFMVEPELAERTKVDGVIALAHAEHVAQQLQDHPEAVQQIGYADQVLLNHCDRVDDLAPAEAAIRRLNPLAAIRHTIHARIDVDSLLSIATTNPALWDLDTSSECTEDHDHTSGNCGPVEHTQGVGALTLRSRAALDMRKLRIWLQFITQRRTWEMMRLKGVLRCTTEGPVVVVQGIYQWFELRPTLGEPPKLSQLVLIGKDLNHEELRRGWAAIGGDGGEE